MQDLNATGELGRDLNRATKTVGHTLEKRAGAGEGHIPLEDAERSLAEKEAVRGLQSAKPETE